MLSDSRVLLDTMIVYQSLSEPVLLADCADATGPELDKEGGSCPGRFSGLRGLLGQKLETPGIVSLGSTHS